MWFTIKSSNMNETPSSRIQSILSLNSLFLLPIHTMGLSEVVLGASPSLEHVYQSW